MKMEFLGYVWVLWVYRFGFIYQRVDKLVGHAIKVPVIKNEVVAPLLPPYFQAMMIQDRIDEKAKWCWQRFQWPWHPLASFPHSLANM
jgi:hypothetical protein